MIDRFFESEKKAWIDLPTNITSLPSFSDASEVRSLIDKDIKPENALPLIHEMTHHWCFNSPVGMALSIVKNRLQENIYRSASSNFGDETFDLIDDLIRYYTTIDYLKPFSEGLALFAEFDAQPNGEFMYSPPLKHYFGLRTVGYEEHIRALMKERKGLLQPSDLASWTSNRFRELRHSELGVARKTDLLCSPVDVQCSPYLSGYLSVKNLYSMNRTVDGVNADNFLSYCRTYIFSDFGLIKAILDVGHEWNLQNRITSYITQRLFTLYDANLEEHFREWDVMQKDETDGNTLDVYADGSVKCDLREPYLRGLMNDRSEELSGYDALKSAIEDLGFEHESDPIVRGMRFSALRNLTLRSLMPVSSVEVTLCERNTKMVRAESGEVFGPFSFVSDQAKSGVYTLEYLCVPTGLLGLREIIVLTLDSEVQAFLDDDYGAEALEKLLPFIAPNSARRSELAALQDAQKLVDNDEAFSGLREIVGIYNFEDNVKQNLVVMYQPLYSHFCRHDDWKSIIEKMSPDGFLGLFDGDIKLFQNFARLSSLASETYVQYEGNSELFAAGSDLEEFKAHYTTYKERYGLAIFGFDYGVVVAFV